MSLPFPTSLPQHPPPVWGSAPPSTRALAPVQGGRSPRPGRIDGVPLPTGTSAWPGGATRGSAAEWETIDLGRSVGSCQPPREPRAAPVREGSPEGGRDPVLGCMGRCLKAGGSLAELVLLGHGVTAVAPVLPRATDRSSAEQGDVGWEFEWEGVADGVCPNRNLSSNALQSLSWKTFQHLPLQEL